MDNGIYIALSRQMALFQDMDMTANNIANVATAGYKGEKMMFDDYLVDSGNSEKKMAFTQDVSSYHDMQNGALQSTGNPLDVAISGPGFFTVNTPLGTRYTRAGNFQIDATGTLVTAEGNPVLDAGGNPIQFADDDKDVVIGENGSIRVDGEERAVLAVVEFANPQLLDHVAGAMFKGDAAAASPAAESHVVQGAIESSNVQPVMELTRMIQINRNTTSTAKLIDAQYDLSRKTADMWAKAV